MAPRGNINKRIKDPLNLIKGELPGQNLLAQIKDAMLKEKVWREMFDKKGKRIYVSELPHYSEENTPLIEFHWESENVQSADTLQKGVISGRIVLPTHFTGELDFFRRVSAAFARFVCSSDNLREVLNLNPGLIELGEPLDFQYNRMLVQDGLKLPFIPFTFPFVFDLVQFRLGHPEIDYGACLDDELIQDLKSYTIKIKDEENGEADGIVLTTIKAKTKKC